MDTEFLIPFHRFSTCYFDWTFKILENCIVISQRFECQDIFGIDSCECKDEGIDYDDDDVEKVLKRMSI